MMRPKLFRTKNSFSSSAIMEQKVIGAIIPEHESGEYFANLRFLSASYRSNVFSINKANQLYETTWGDSLRTALEIDTNDPQELIDILHRVQRNTGIKNELAIFNVNVRVDITETDTFAGEFAEVRKWRALQKLTEQEIELLGMMTDYTYLKLKYHETN